MVGLDLSSIDRKIIQRVSHLSRIIKPDIIHFVHVEKELDIPIYVPAEYKDVVPTATEQYEEKMRTLVEDNFDNASVEWKVSVVGGKTFDTLVNWVKEENIDFFIAGRKKSEEGSGILPHKLLRSLICPALFIPESKMPGSKKILVAVDFSDHSMMALKTAIKLAESGEITVHCLHIYSVPIGYHSTGKTYDEFSEIMRVNAEKEFKRFSKALDAELDLKCVLLEKTSPAEVIYEECKSGNYDLVIMGSKGQSAGSVMLLGSTSEKLIRMNYACMSWIVKIKDEYIGFFKALSKL